VVVAHGMTDYWAYFEFEKGSKDRHMLVGVNGEVHHDRKDLAAVKECVEMR
jgi:hypothetical protein